MVDPVHGGFNQEKCEAGEKLQLLQCASLDHSRWRAERAQILAEWQAGLPPAFSYDFRVLEGGRKVEARPICVRRLGPVTLNEKMRVRYSPTLNFNYKLNLTETLQLDPRVEIQTRAGTELDLELQKSSGVWIINSLSDQKMSSLPECEPHLLGDIASALKGASQSSSERQQICEK